jgi:predicted RNA-binding Zn ribbon-like protein
MSDRPTTLPPWVQDIETKPAPMPLLQAQAFVNTWEWETSLDVLADEDTGWPWLVGAGLMDAGTPAGLGAGDLAQVRASREAVRALLIVNAGGPEPDPAEVAPLLDLARGGQLQATVGAGGLIDLAPGAAAAPLCALAARLLVIIRDAQRDGTWARLKACGCEQCRWAFYDRSHARRGTWCDMAVCGNRLKNRALRARKLAH